MRINRAGRKPAVPRSRAIDNAPPRRAVSLRVDANLLREARESHLNLSAMLERALVAQLRRSRAERWLVDNKDAMAAYNALVHQHGAFADILRAF
jgi:antitoxin CcdA